LNHCAYIIIIIMSFFVKLVYCYVYIIITSLNERSFNVQH
jgi:hypothetical protein